MTWFRRVFKQLFLFVIMIEPKALFVERMKKLLPDEQDLTKFMSIIHEKPKNWIRCNTLKITPEELKKKLEEKGWKISQKFKDYPEMMLIENELGPGELGKSIEHLIGYYYVQEICSMMSVLALDCKPGEIVLDLCASPGSKTTQMAAKMQNTGTIIANDKDLGRITILAANLERCGATNTIITREDAVQLCVKLKEISMKFDRILVDAPCSGEGTLRSSPKTFIMWNVSMIEKLSRLQKKMVSSVLPLLKEGGVLVYSTCTHAPEEDESVVSFLAEKFDMDVEEIYLPLKCRHGVEEWKTEKFKGSENVCRIYPQDNDSEGFFVAKLKKKPN